jgi:hypothetical protein
MSITITTSFYEYDTPDWHDLSTVVYTSPNLPTPSDDGTRSHILPGQLPLATWYETIDTMWLIYNRQVASMESFYPAIDPFTTISGFDLRNSITFEVTSGESYLNRLTAWDDVTHNSIDNELIATNRVKASCANYSWSGGTEDAPVVVKYGGPLGILPPYDPLEPFAPQYNITLKGNTTSGINDNYYGDFDMIWAYNTSGFGRRGDYLIVRPWLDNIDASVTYGNHDYVITLHFQYT